MTLRLEVYTGSSWLNVLGSTNSIQISRSPLNLGTLTANLVDVALDPATSSTLASGRAVRVQVETSTTWRSIFTGVISQAKVSYNQSPIAAKRAQIELSAVDLMQSLGTKVEPRSVARTNELRTLLNASGYPWRVNGTTAAGPTSPVVVGNNPGAFLADQIAITRDSVQGYAWVDGDGVIQVYDPGSMPTATVATYTDVSDQFRSYSTIDVSYDSADVVDEVIINFLRYKPVGNVTEEIQYGPYRRPGATGTNTRTYTIAGLTENAASIASYAQGILDRNNSAVVRPMSLRTPVRSPAERESVAAADLCSRVRVKYGASLDRIVRVDSIEHNITAVTGKASTIDWITDYTFTVPEAVPESQRLQLLPPIKVSERFEAVEASTADSAAKANNAQIVANASIATLVGVVLPFAGSVPPSGFLLCNGSSVSRHNYNQLFAIIGTAYGSESSTTFNLPDLRGRFPIGAGTFASRGENDGAAESARTPRHRHTGPAHSHSIVTGGGHSHGGSTGQGPSQRAGATTNGANNEGFASHTHPISFDGAHNHDGATGTAGTGWTGYAGDDGSNAIPYIGLNYIIRAEGPSGSSAA